jgi:hypothetical protein
MTLSSHFNGEHNRGSTGPAKLKQGQVKKKLKEIMRKQETYTTMAKLYNA